MPSVKRLFDLSAILFIHFSNRVYPVIDLIDFI